MLSRIVEGRRGRVVFRPDLRINGIKIFSVTMHQQRASLGETVSAWIEAHPELTIVDITIAQSSDDAFHCITFVIGYRESPPKR